MEAKTNVDIVSCSERLSRNRGSYTLYASPRRKSLTQDMGKATDLDSDIEEENEEFFEVFVMKEKFKFSCAHFVAFQGFRERLHGHNYQVGVRMRGKHYGYDGYVIDFGDIKKVATNVCKELNEHFICPMQSDVLQISILDDSEKANNKTSLVEDEREKEHKEILIECEDGVRFIFPLSDVACLPIKHSTAEELAVYIWNRIVSIPVEISNNHENDKDISNVNVKQEDIKSSKVDKNIKNESLKTENLPVSFSNIGKQKGICVNDLIKRGIYRVEVNVAEAVNQEAKYSRCLHGAYDGVGNNI